ncbi:peptide-methionine (S)-S-oxide reductase MsrA [Pseudooceanicola aestuarii]|uniref:peptide-methionine (S)-S-oxide reductase MsrA n=1 Tax=Pseudooceanicola aestuarii TaxID=2697319 RepID=UPI0013D0DB1B|nr:peptide-methionine (S)-S-oxide reductase MsrA [Pseudooceanicola aestuarii]
MPRSPSFPLRALTLLAATALPLTPVQAAPTEEIIVAGGCFWCVEADFEKIPGVTEAVSGFTGGDVKNPSYKQVTGGGTGHYEAVRITFDPDRVSRETLYDRLVHSIDAVDDGGQFCDRGNSYRPAIFVANAAERATAQAVLDDAAQELTSRGITDPIVVPLLDQGPFYDAEAYHQDYYKSQDLILTRFGPRRKEKAYELYRDACQRDARLRQLWGDAAFPGVGG